MKLKEMFLVLFTMVVGFVVLMTCHNPLLLTCGFIMFLGAIYVISYLTVLTLRIKTYKFTHYFNSNNNLKDIQTLVFQLSTTQIRSIMKYNKDMFDKTYLYILDVVQGIDLQADKPYTKVTGYVKARNRKEAENNIKYFDYTSYIGIPEDDCFLEP
jgi:hypothetical protein